MADISPSSRYKISVTLQVFFLTLHAVTGFDFGFLMRKSFKAKVLINMYTLLYCCAFCTLTLYGFRMPDDNTKEFFTIGIYVFMLFAQYIYNCLVLAFNYNKSFYVLLKTLVSVDDMLAVNTNVYSLEFIIIGSLSVSVLFRIVNLMLYIVYFPSEFTDSELINGMAVLQLVFCDIIAIMSFMYLYAIYCRLKNLSSIVEKCEQRMPNFIMAYKILADSLDEFSTPLIYLHLMALALKIPELLVAAYLALSNIKYGENMFVDDQLARTLYTIQVIVLLFSPAMCAGFLSAEAEKLKINLYEKLIMERDEHYACFLEQFAEYVTARPLRLKMLNVVPLDWTLPIVVLDLTISYQILIVQFTHLY